MGRPFVLLDASLCLCFTQTVDIGYSLGETVTVVCFLISKQFLFILEALENTDKQKILPQSGLGQHLVLSPLSLWFLPSGSSPLHLKVLWFLIKSSIDLNSLDLA